MTVGVGGLPVDGEGRILLDRLDHRLDDDPPAPVERLEGVGQQVREDLAQLMVIAIDQRERRLDVQRHGDVAAARPCSRPA